MKRLLSVLACAALVTALVGIAAPAQAGVGASQWCDDGATLPGGTAIPILNSPLTFGLEVGASPAYLVLCYSTTSWGDGTPAIAGGHIFVHVDNRDVICRTDDNSVIDVECQVGAYPGGVVVSVTPRVQSIAAPVGVSTGLIDAVACLRDVTVTTPAGVVGPVDIGVCV